MNSWYLTSPIATIYRHMLQGWSARTEKLNDGRYLITMTKIDDWKDFSQDSWQIYEMDFVHHTSVILGKEEKWILTT